MGQPLGLELYTEKLKPIAGWRSKRLGGVCRLIYIYCMVVKDVHFTDKPGDLSYAFLTPAPGSSPRPAAFRLLGNKPHLSLQGGCELYGNTPAAHDPEHTCASLYCYYSAPLINLGGTFTRAETANAVNEIPLCTVLECGTWLDRADAAALSRVSFNKERDAVRARAPALCEITEGRGAACA
jgi:hypothetical protein